MREQSQTFGQFFTANVRWLGGGVLLTFSASIGQTFFIAGFAGAIRTDFDLSHGDFGLIYMLATLASAASLIVAGRLLDHYSVVRIAMALIVLLAGSALLMAFSTTVYTLLLSIYLLRLLGQGMLSHTAMVAMGRWFVVERGRAVSITTTGHQLGEGVLPVLIVALLAMADWRTAWIVAAMILLIVGLPLAYVCLATPRTPSQRDHDNFENGRQWTRAEVLRDIPFWVVCTGVLAPAFIGTSVFFHQVHLTELKQWPAATVAGSFAIMSITSITVGLLTGQLIDRFSARQLLPFFLLPLAVGCVVLSLASHPTGMSLFMFLLGASYGVSSAVFGAIWPEVYGTRHLGAVRSVVSAAMVFASALGPGFTGWLIDINVQFEWQLMIMAAYCLITMAGLFPVSRVLSSRSLAGV